MPSPYNSFLPFSPPFIPPLHSKFSMIMSSSAMLFTQEPIHLDRFDCPVLETGLTTAEIQEFVSLLRAGNSASPNSGSEGSNRAVYSVDERKRRRMTSNRESARRSRWRKKRHTEDLTNEVNQLKVQNQELKDRLSIVAQRCHITWRDNDRLTSDSLALRDRLSDLYGILVAMQMQ